MIHIFGQHDPLGVGERLCTEKPVTGARYHTLVHARVNAHDDGDCTCVDCGARFMKNHGDDEGIVDSR